MMSGYRRYVYFCQYLTLEISAWMGTIAIGTLLIRQKNSDQNVFLNGCSDKATAISNYVFHILWNSYRKGLIM